MQNLKNSKILYWLISIVILGVYLVASYFSVQWFPDYILFTTIIIDLVIAAIAYVVLRFVVKSDSNESLIHSKRNAILISILFVCVAVVISMDFNWFSIHLSDPALNKYQETATMNTILMSVLSFIIAPISEEMLFRGLIYNSLKKGSNIIVACIIQIGLFTILHGTLSHVLGCILFGLFLTIVYDLNQKIWPCIVFHSVYNISTMWQSLFILNDTFLNRFVLIIANVILFAFMLTIFLVINNVYKKVEVEKC